MRRRYPSEMALFERRSRSSSTHPSVVLFTLHKCASVFTRDIFRALATDTALVPVNFDGLAFGGELTPAERERIFLRPSPELYPVRGYCFAPFRYFHAGIPDISPYRVVLMLRDPRDVLVSFYFSMAQSHRTPAAQTMSREILLNEREAASRCSIDQYVVEKAPEFVATYESYLAYVFGKPNVLFTTYEQMIASFEPWLQSIINHCGFTPSSATIQSLVSAAKVGVETEDPSKHIRQVTPGDHRRKLKPETIAALNAQFVSVMDRLGYNP